MASEVVKLNSSVNNILFFEKVIPQIANLISKEPYPTIIFDLNQTTFIGVECIPLFLVIGKWIKETTGESARIFSDLNLPINEWLYNFGFTEINRVAKIFLFAPFYPINSGKDKKQLKNASVFYFERLKILREIEANPIESIRTILWRELSKTQFRIASCLFQNPKSHVVDDSNRFYDQISPEIQPIIKNILELTENSIDHGACDCAVAITTKINYRNTKRRFLLVTVTDFGRGPVNKLTNELIRGVIPSEDEFDSSELARREQRVVEYKAVRTFIDKELKTNANTAETIAILISMLLYRRTEYGFGLFSVLQLSRKYKATIYLTARNVRLEVYSEGISDDLIQQFQMSETLTHTSIDLLFKSLLLNYYNGTTDRGMQIELAVPFRQEWI